MTYGQFCLAVVALDLTPAELRCDFPPTDDVLELIESCGANYEAFATRYLTIDSTAAVADGIGEGISPEAARWADGR